MAPAHGSVRAVLSVIGEALIDLVDTGDRVTFRALPGGSPLNVAVGAARLGEPTALLARFGPDAFGRLLRRHAADNGVDVTACVAAAEPTTLAVVSVGPDGGASYDFYVDGTADWQWTAAELALPAQTSIVHFGSLASWLGPGDEVIRDMIARSGALVSYDPNVRPRLLGEPEHGRPVIEANVAVADVVKASDEDLAWLYPDRDAGAVAVDWLSSGPVLVVVTAGADGATAYRSGADPVHRPAAPVTVVDTVGAGDSWMGGLLAGLHRAGTVDRQSVAGLDPVRLAGLLDEALLVAAITCGREGADPPTLAELRTRQ